MLFEDDKFSVVDSEESIDVRKDMKCRLWNAVLQERRSKTKGLTSLLILSHPSMNEP